MAKNDNILITSMENKRGSAPIIKQIDTEFYQILNTSISKI